jgi:hypothetical protein
MNANMHPTDKEVRNIAEPTGHITKSDVENRLPRNSRIRLHSGRLRSGTGSAESTMP